MLDAKTLINLIFSFTTTIVFGVWKSSRFHPMNINIIIKFLDTTNYYIRANIFGDIILLEKVVISGYFSSGYVTAPG